MHNRDQSAIRDEICDVRSQIRGLRYLIKMDKVSRIDRSHPLVRKLELFEQRVNKLLVMVRRIRTSENRNTTSGV